MWLEKATLLMRKATVGNNNNVCLLSSSVSKALLCLDLKKAAFIIFVSFISSAGLETVY